MQDSFGRTIDYLRVSVTDRCNLRCVYCMPEEGVQMTAHENLLSYDEIVRICRIAAGMGVQKIKLTGGEPLVRRDIPVLVRKLKQIKGIENVTLTTNGVVLASWADELMEAGLDGVNISLDTVDPKRFREITRRDMLPQVLTGIVSVLGREGLSVKINCVPMEQNKQDMNRIAAFAQDYPVHVRFIEMMPVGYGKNFSFIGEEEIKRLLEAEYGTLRPFEGKLGNGPGHYYELDGFCGKVGFISAISHKFCDRCNRVRLTSQGFLKTCLQYDSGRDLREMLRGGADDVQMAEAIAEAVASKPGSHYFLAEEIRNENSMCMSQIGG